MYVVSGGVDRRFRSLNSTCMNNRQVPNAAVTGAVLIIIHYYPEL